MRPPQLRSTFTQSNTSCNPPTAMVTVASLLNPLYEEPHPFPSPVCSTRFTPDVSSTSSPPSAKRKKLAKDAAVFSRGKVRGEIRYPPWESYDPQTLEELKKFSIYPLNRIAEYRRHIPYNSNKKTFLDKTGRDGFDGLEPYARGHGLC